ncbi:MAG: hypothetical protein AAF466_12025 [Bacteroidota bacterium]
MKILVYILIAIGLGLIVFNATKLDLSDPFTGDSAVAAVGIMAAACAVLLMVILRMAQRLKTKNKE